MTLVTLVTLFQVSHIVCARAGDAPHVGNGSLLSQVSSRTGYELRSFQRSLTPASGCGKGSNGRSSAIAGKGAI